MTRPGECSDPWTLGHQDYVADQQGPVTPQLEREVTLAMTHAPHVKPGETK